MSEPDETLTILSLMGERKDLYFHSWHKFTVKSPNGGNAGRWCREMIRGRWTFDPDFGRVDFYIEDAQDAMAFKLAWA